MTVCSGESHTFSYDSDGDGTAEDYGPYDATASPYTVSVTDANGCPYDLVFTINEYEVTPQPTIMVVEATCEAAGTANISNYDATFTYTFSPTGPTVDGSGNISDFATDTAYTVIATSAAPELCESLVSDSFRVDEANDAPAQPIITIVDTTCDAEGSASISNFDPTVNYTFIPAGPSAEVDGSITGIAIETTYTVTAISAAPSNCESMASESFMISKLLELVCQPTTVKDVICYGTATGSATANVNGGTAPYSYLWSDGQTTQTALGLAADIYTVTITDINGCKIVCDAVVDEPDEPLLGTVIQKQVTCIGGADGEIDLTVVGGTPPYSFEWTGPNDFSATTEDISNIMVGTYTVTITDANGCSHTCASTIISLNEPLDAGDDNSIEVCEGDIIDLSTLTTVDGGVFSDVNGDLSGSDYDTTGLVGDYEIIYTVSNGACPDDKAIITVTVLNDVRVRECNVIDADYCSATEDPNYSFYWHDPEGGFSGNGFFSSNATHTMTFTEYDNGTALIKGSTQQGDCSLDIYVFLKDKKDWAAWSDPSNGGSFKDEGCTGAVQEDLNYYVIDGERSFAQVTGGDCYGEGIFQISQMPDPNDPNTPNYGVNVGPGGALFDSNGLTDGLAGWGWMGPEDDPRRWKIDFNLVFDCQETTGCITEYPTSLNSTIDQELINSTCSDSATVEVSGGTSPYSYLWSDGQITATAVNLGDGQHNVIVTDANGYQSYSSVNISKYVDVELRAFLGGPFNKNTGLMNDYLRASNLIPTVSPYIDSATCDSSVFNITGNDAIIDWVWIEVRDLSQTNVVVETSALIQADGDIVNTDGVSPLSFDVPTGAFYFMIGHRNHLGIITANALSLQYCSRNIIDLSADINAIYRGINGAEDLGNGFVGLYSGDCDGNGQIQNIDRVDVIDILGASGLSDGDIDMNGQVQNIDLNIKLIPNLGKGFQSNAGDRGSNTGIDLQLYAKKRN